MVGVGVQGAGSRRELLKSSGTGRFILGAGESDGGVKSIRMFLTGLTVWTTSYRGWREVGSWRGKRGCKRGGWDGS